MTEDQIYKKYCSDIPEEVKRLLLSSNNSDRISMYNEISTFANTLMNEIDSLDFLNPDRHYNVHGTDITYESLKPTCKKKPLCKKPFDFMFGEKSFIPQLYHIVQDFGVYAPLKLFILQFESPPSDEVIKNKVQKATLDGKVAKFWYSNRMKQHVFGIPPGVFRKNMKDLRNTPQFDENGNSLGTLEDDGRLLGKMLEDKATENINDFSNKPYDDEFQIWIEEFFKRSQTVLQLRYFDFYVCSNFKPASITGANRDHRAVYNNHMQAMHNVLKKLQKMNSNREFNISLRPYDLPNHIFYKEFPDTD